MSRNESPVDMGGYDNSHRAFLQAFLSNPVMTVDEVKPLLAAVMTAHDAGRPTMAGDITTPDITAAIQTINARLHPLDYEIRSTRSQTDRTLTYALVNTTSDSLTQLATSFTPDEMAYIKRLLDAMFETNNTARREIMAVSTVEASQLAKAPRNRDSRAATAAAADEDDEDEDDNSAPQLEASAKSLSIADSDRVLAVLVSQAFLTRSRAGYYTLAPRALMELRSYLKETYNEASEDGDAEDGGGVDALIRIRDCEACREIVTMGQRCRETRCGCRLHEHCTAQLFRQVERSERKCPVCRTEWTGDCFVGERAAGVERRRTGGARRGGG